MGGCCWLSVQCVFHLFPEFSVKRSLQPKTGNMGRDFSGGAKKQRRGFFFSSGDTRSQYGSHTCFAAPKTERTSSAGSLTGVALSVDACSRKNIAERGIACSTAQLSSESRHR